MNLKMSCQEQLGVGATFEERCAMLAEMGFEAVEVWGRNLIGDPKAVAKNKKILDQCGLKVSAVVVGYKRTLLSVVPGERNEAREGVEDLLRISGDLGAVGLIVVPVFGNSEIPDLSPVGTKLELEDRLMVDHLRELGPVAAAADTRVILEPLNRGETKYLNTLDHAAKLIDEAGVDGLALMGDVFHMNIEETSIIAAFERNIGKLAHVHLADNTRLEPSTGMTDFPGIITALKKIGYDHYVSFECRLSGDKGETLRKAFDHVKSCSGGDATG